jgi:hypothetical protein
VLYCAIAGSIFWPVWRHVRHVWIGLGSDTDLLIWALRWTPYAIAHGINPFFTTHLNYPTGVNLGWNPLMPVVGVVMWPITALAGPIAAYNVMLAGGMSLSGWCAYLLIRRHVRWRAAALIGGLVYGFSPYMTAQAISHGNLVLVATLPILVLLLDEIVVRQRWSAVKGGGLFGLVLAVQFLAFQEVAATAVIVAVIGLAILAATRPELVRYKRRYALRALCVAVPVFLLLTGYPIYEQFFGPLHLVGAVHSEDTYVTDLLNLVVPTPGLLVAPGRATALASTFTGNITEWDGYLGIPLLLTCLLTVVALWREVLIRVAGLTALLVLLLSFGPYLHVGGQTVGLSLPWRLLGAIPGLEHILPARMAVYLDLFAALLLARGLVEVRRGRGIRRMGGLGTAALVAVLCILPLVPRVPLPTTSTPLPTYFTSGAPGMAGGSPVLVAPFPTTCDFDPDRRGPVCRTSDPMVWQALADMRFKMPGGYFVGIDESGHTFYGAAPTVTSTALGRVEEGVDAPSDAESASLRAAILAELHRWQIGAVIVGPMPRHRDEVVQFVTALLGRAPASEQGVDMWVLR